MSRTLYGFSDNDNISRSIGNLEFEVKLLESSGGYLYAGLPKFKALFGRDSLTTGWQLIDWRKEIAMSSVRALMRLQGEKFNPKIGEHPGKIPHEYFDSHSEYAERKMDIPWLPKGPNYFSVDSTPLFVIVTSMLMERFPKFATAEVRNSVIKSLMFLVGNIKKNDLLTYEKALGGMGIQSQSWRDGIGDILDRLKSPVATIGVQGYLFHALNLGLRLLAASGSENNDLKMQLRKHLSNLPATLDNYFWSEEDSYFFLAFDGDGVAEKAITSDPGHLIFSGILSKRREMDVIDILFDSDLLTDYGIRTLSKKDKRFDEKAYQRGSVWPQDNWIIAQGLKMRGYYNRYKEIREKLLFAYEEMGKMPEYFGVDNEGRLLPTEKMRIRPCYPQSWSTGAIISFLLDKMNEVEKRSGDEQNGSKT